MNQASAWWKSRATRGARGRPTDPAQLRFQPRPHRVTALPLVVVAKPKRRASAMDLGAVFKRGTSDRRKRLLLWRPAIDDLANIWSGAIGTKAAMLMGNQARKIVSGRKSDALRKRPRPLGSAARLLRTRAGASLYRRRCLHMARSPAPFKGSTRPGFCCGPAQHLSHPRRRRAARRRDGLKGSLVRVRSPATAARWLALGSRCPRR
jgi:hypothetical protein